MKSLLTISVLGGIVYLLMNKKSEAKDVKDLTVNDIFDNPTYDESKLYKQNSQVVAMGIRG